MQQIAQNKSNHKTIEMCTTPQIGRTPNITNSYTYDPAWNKVKTAVDGNGNTTTYTYDPTHGYLTQIQFPTVSAGTPYVYFSYNSNGQLLTATDPTGIITLFTYNATTKNLLTQVIDSGTGHLNLTTTFTYDAVGNVATVEDPNGNTTTVVFDKSRRLSTITAPPPFNYVTSLSYDSNNNVTQVKTLTATIPQTYTAVYTIDDLVSSITESLINSWGQQPNPMIFTYDDMRRLEQVTDAQGNSYTCAYDALSRIHQITYPNGIVSDTNTYTDNGFLESTVDATGNETRYSPDGFDRLDTTTYADTTTEQYVYDDNNNVTQITIRSGNTIGFTYDALNDTLTKSPQGQATVTYTYDLAGRMTSASVPVVSGDPSTGLFQQFYDTAGRFYKEEYSSGLTVTSGLDSNGNVTSITYPDSTVITRVYDQLNRLTSISDSLGSAAFTYDSLAHRIGQTYGNGLRCGFGYDFGDNLLSLGFNTSPPLQFAYVYNSVHQEVGRQVNNSVYLWEPSADSSVSYGTANNVNQYPNVAGNTYSYNSNGCLTGDGTFTYSYNTENQLLSVAGTGVSVSYEYDPLGRQVLKTVGSTTTQFIYSGLQRIADYSSSGSLINRYVSSDNLDETLWAENSGTTTYFHLDETESVIMISNSAGSVTNQPPYTPWGESTSVNSFNIGFAGLRYDPEVGLYYCRARYYSPSLGRFLQNDPLGYDGSDLNLYDYVNNDPLNLSDSLGLSPAGGGGGGGAGLVPLEPIYDYTPSSNSNSAPPASIRLQGGVSQTQISFLQALMNNTDAFWDTYKDPWFWVTAAVSAIPAGRLAVGAAETAYAYRTAQGILKTEYTLAKATFPTKTASQIGTMVHKAVDVAINKAKNTGALKAGEFYKGGKVAQYAEKGSAQIDGRVMSKIAGYVASFEYKTGKAVMRATQRARIMKNAPKIQTWFRDFDSPVYQIKPQ